MRRPRILVTRHIPKEAGELLSSRFEVDYRAKDTAIQRRDLLARIKDKDGLLCVLTERVDQELLRAASRLRAVATYSVGFDHVDLAACAKRLVAVTHTPDVLTETTADFTWALILASCRRVVEGDRCMRAGRYRGWDPLMLLGADVFGKTLGIVGFGRIGRAVARRAAGFSMKILYYDLQRVFPEIEKEFQAEFAELEDLLERADFVTLHTALDESTRHLINARTLAAMKPSAYLINAARGPIVDEKALVEALQNGRIRGAALDVYEHEPKMAPGLSRLSNVVLAPHLASASLETRTRMGMMAAQSLVDVLCNGKMPEHPVNPDICGRILGISRKD
ncbi:MAG: 2-hydroxyacid dehydrogenase [Elusimicrobiota bacterium]